MIRWALIAAAISGALAVVIGALGAHALGSLPGADARAVFQTAWRYHSLHTLAVLIATLAPQGGAHRGACVMACAAWIIGIAIFSGSLYLLAVTGASWFGAITPIGGLALIGGWIALATSGLLNRTP